MDADKQWRRHQRRRSGEHSHWDLPQAPLYYAFRREEFQGSTLPVTFPIRPYKRSEVLNGLKRAELQYGLKELHHGIKDQNGNNANINCSIAHSTLSGAF